MVGGKGMLANELSVIIHRIQRLERDDPVRVTEETALVDVVMRKRRRSAVPLGDGAYSLLVAPGGPLARPTPPGPSGPHVTLVAALLNRRPHLSLSLGRLVPRED